jgi:hypothetical protein
MFSTGPHLIAEQLRLLPMLLIKRKHKLMLFFLEHLSVRVSPKWIHTIVNRPHLLD